MKIFNNLPKLSSEDTANSIVTYESMDNADVTSWTDVDVIESGEKHHSLFKKISTMFKNIRYLFKTLGTTDISAIGDGTVTGGLSKINNDLSKGLVVSEYYLSAGVEGSNGAFVTTTKTLYQTLDNDFTQGQRKFSDYNYLCFELLVNSNTVRASIVVPRTRFTRGKYSIELTYVDSTNTQRWVSITYNSDTSYYMYGSSNISIDTRVQISGMVAEL